MGLLRKYLYQKHFLLNISMIIKINCAEYKYVYSRCAFSLQFRILKTYMYLIVKIHVSMVSYKYIFNYLTLMLIIISSQSNAATNNYFYFICSILQ